MECCMKITRRAQRPKILKYQSDANSATQQEVDIVTLGDANDTNQVFPDIAKINELTADITENQRP